ncbi:hypothetical protein [Polaribacter aestuariivivens]|uniref:hypothetical protein n=1 Tax=Polaribacter aestuariivivens TaxID=2304626 RepID=UPI003F497C24
MQIVIKRAAIKGSLFLSYDFEQTDVDVKNNIKTSSDAPIHEDLKNAFRKLIPHFAFICEEITNKKLVEKAIGNPDLYLKDRETAPDDAFFKYRVFEFKVVEKDGDEKVTISGSKQLVNLKEISFSTPDKSLFDEDYPFRKELNENIDELKNEVLEYMQGKSAPKAQMEMFQEEED